MPASLQFDTDSETGRNGDYMQKTIAITMMLSMLLLTGCGDSLPEDELVNRGRESQMENANEDLQASSFPYLNMEEDYQKERKFYTLPELRQEVKEE